MFHSQTLSGYPINIPLSFHGYNVKQYIGCGCTSVVALVEDPFTQNQYSAKIMSKKDIEKRKLTHFILNEIKIHKSINHKNIIKVYDSFEIKNEFEDEYYVIIMEYCSNGSLLNYVSTKGFENDSEKRKILLGFLEAIKFLHNKGISHGDIKSDNVLLDKYMTPKLSDFGFCRTSIYAGEDSKNGTLYYASPELFYKGYFNTLKSDIWAIGITLYSILERQFPFENSDQDSIVNQIVKGQLSIRTGLNTKLKILIEQCTMKNPEHRPTIDEIINHEFFNFKEIGRKKRFILPKSKAIKKMTFENMSFLDTNFDEN